MTTRDTGQATVQSATETKQRAISSIRAHWMSNAIHELRGPIFAARGYTKLILENRGGDVTVTQQRYLTSVLENINKLSAIVTTLQDLPSEDVLNIEQFSFRHLLENVIR